MTFIVRDLARMKQIIEQVLGGREVYDSGETQFSLSKEKFFLVNDLWIATMEGPSLKERSYNHIAFKVTPEQLAQGRAAIVALGLEMRESRPRVTGEGASIYFYDDDNHFFELHTGTLNERLARYAEGR